MIRFLIFFLIFWTVFGPKLYIVDLSVFVGLFLTGIIIQTRPINTPINIRLFENTILLIIYFIYVLLIQIINNIESSDVILRIFRSISISIIIICSSFFLVKNGRLIIPILVLILFIHGLILIIAAHNLDFNLLLGEIFSNDKVRDGRSSGLVSGFDVAGYFCIIGLLAVFTQAYPIKSLILRFGLALFFVIACYFASRVSMILALLILFLMILKFLFVDKEIRFANKILITVFFTPIFLYAAYEVVLIFEVALKLGFIAVSQSQEVAVTQRFASSTVEEAGLLSMYFLPPDWEEMIFGAGTNIPSSDVGYVKLVYWNGLVGVLLVILIHLHLLGSTIMNLNHDIQTRRERLFVLGVYAMTFVLTFKNNYMLTRGVWTLLLLLYLHSLWRKHSGVPTIAKRQLPS